MNQKKNKTKNPKKKIPIDWFYFFYHTFINLNFRYSWENYSRQFSWIFCLCWKKKSEKKKENIEQKKIENDGDLSRVEATCHSHKDIFTRGQRSRVINHQTFFTVVNEFNCNNDTITHTKPWMTFHFFFLQIKSHSCRLSFF